MSDDPTVPQEAFLSPPSKGQGKAKSKPKYASVSKEILKLVAKLPAKTSGVAEIKKGAATLAKVK